MRFVKLQYALRYRIPGISGSHQVAPATAFDDFDAAHAYRDRFTKFYLDNDPLMADASEVERLKSVDFYVETHELHETGCDPQDD